MLREKITTIIRPQVCSPRKLSILLLTLSHFPNSWQHHVIAYLSAITERDCIHGKQRKFTIFPTQLISNSWKVVARSTRQATCRPPKAFPTPLLQPMHG